MSSLFLYIWNLIDPPAAALNGAALTGTLVYAGLKQSLKRTFWQHKKP